MWEACKISVGKRCQNLRMNKVVSLNPHCPLVNKKIVVVCFESGVIYRIYQQIGRTHV